MHTVYTFMLHKALPSVQWNASLTDSMLANWQIADSGKK